MKQQEVFKKIGIIINEINDQYNYLKGEGESLNDLELELFVANSHFLAEHAEVLRKLNTHNLPAIQPQTNPSEKYFEPVVQQVKHEADAEPEPQAPSKPVEIEITNTNDNPVPHIDLAANGADDDFSIMRREPEVIKHELVLDESQDWDEEDDQGFEIDEAADIEAEEQVIVPEPEVKKPEPVKEAPITVPEVKKEVPPVSKEVPPTAPVEHKNELETEEPLTINQRISAQLSKTARLSEQLHEHSIADLKQAINLNDKLLYIKDLFNGYNLAYSEAIDILNRFSTFQEADDFLQKNYAVKNHWESKQTTVDKFYMLLRRRYA